MTKTTKYRPSLLGDLRAEADSAMLSRAFLETADFRTLIESSDSVIVVGRRGTGKSALTVALERHWQNAKSAEVVKLAPEEHQVIGVRPLVQLFGTKFPMMRAGARLVWRYALMMETVQCVARRRKYSPNAEMEYLQEHLQKWIRRGANVFDRLRQLMREVIDAAQTAEERIGNLPIQLDLRRIEEAVASITNEQHVLVVFLIDRLDEGYEPDDTGVGFIDGLVQAAIDLKTRVPRIRPTLFLRDNIFRAIEKLDPDFSRNIEGHVLRLHWNEGALLEFAAKRLQIALDIHEQSSQRTWNRCVMTDLSGHDGFAKCLQLTLYRPRDLLALLNEALYLMGKNKQALLSTQHIESTAKLISQHRLQDLHKEYESIIPGLGNYVSVFSGKYPELDVGELTELIERLLSDGSDDPVVQQDFLILDDAKSVIRGLYSVGFLGVRDATTGTFIFCHDGRAPDKEFTVGDKVLVHPCYWMALNCTRNHLNADEAQEIHDEYDIEVASETPAIRTKKINELIEQLQEIPEGRDGDAAFEQWCHKAIRICFAKSLNNIELKPNKLAKQRRDVVGTNISESGAWRRIYEDYGTRQVTFEIKNYRDVQSADYQQIVSYLHDEYGRLGFIVTREDSVDLFSNKDVEWVREVYSNHKRLVIKLTGKYFTKLLYKLRDPQRQNSINEAISKLLDTYTRLYLAGQTMTQSKDEKRKKRQERRAARKLRKVALQVQV